MARGREFGSTRADGTKEECFFQSFLFFILFCYVRAAAEHSLPLRLLLFPRQPFLFQKRKGEKTEDDQNYKSIIALIAYITNNYLP